MAFLLRLFEVGILENVRRGTHQAEADAVAAGVALGEAVAGDHYRFVRCAVIALVQHLVDAGVRDWSARAEYAAVGTALMLSARSPAFELRAKTS